LGKPKNYVKEETVKRIKTLLKKYTREELEESKEFQSLCNHYINSFEREHLDTIVDMCSENLSYDEIRLKINGGNLTMSKKKPTTKTPKETNEAMDPVAEEAVFMISQQRVVETEPVDVIIGDDDSAKKNNEKKSDIEEDSKATETIDVDFVELEDVIDSGTVILSDVVKDSKKQKSKKQKENNIKDIIDNEFETEDADDEGPGFLAKWFSKRHDNFLKRMKEIDDDIEKENARLEKIAEETRKRILKDLEQDSKEEAAS